MSSSPNRRKALGALFLFLTLVGIPFAMVYYASTDYYQARFQQWRKKNVEASNAVSARRSPDHYVVARGEKLKTNKIWLEYKGIEEKKFRFDLYLLDFDPKQPFPVQVSKKEAKESFTVAGHQFKMLSGNDRFINLKLVHKFQTP